jgi:hypothetical protein
VDRYSIRISPPAPINVLSCTAAGSDFPEKVADGGAFGPTAPFQNSLSELPSERYRIWAVTRTSCPAGATSVTLVRPGVTSPVKYIGNATSDRSSDETRSSIATTVPRTAPLEEHSFTTGSNAGLKAVLRKPLCTNVLAQAALTALIT